jgi:predicted DNA-binding protein with PD1-like motif
MNELTSTRKKKYRLDIDADLYENIFAFSKANGIKESTKGSVIISQLKQLFGASSKPIAINEKTSKVLDSFQKFGILDGHSLTDAVHQALEVYIKEHKAELQQKISEL